MITNPIQKVLVVSFSVVPAADRQGVEIETVLKALAARFQVDVLTIRTADMGYVERYRRTRMLRVPVGTGSRLEQVEAFRRAVKRQLEGTEYDLIHFRSAYGGLPICQLREYLDCKLVFELALNSSTEAGRVDQQAHAALVEDERFCLEHADLVIARCESAAEALRKTLGETPVAVVPPGVDIDTFDWEPSASQPAHRIVHVGTLGPARGIRLLLEAFRELLNYSDANLVLAGSVESIFASYLEDALDHLQLRNHVTLLGPVDHEEIPRILAMADLCVCPWSPPEDQPLYGYPLKLFEYMACRKPVIAVDQQVLQELLGPRPPVKLVKPDNPSDLASAMLQLLADEKQRLRLSEDAYALVRAQYSASGARRALLSAYEKLYPKGTNLWSHEGVVPRPVTGTYTSQSGSDRLHDTHPHLERSYFGVTPSGGIRSLESQARAAETWILRGPEERGDSALTKRPDEPTTDPEFVAEGSLLGSDVGPRSSSTDTSPEAATPSEPQEQGPETSP